MSGATFYSIGRIKSRKVIVAAAISIFAGQAPLLLKPIIAGKILGGNAIAAMSLVAPVLEVCYALIFLLVVGASYLVTECVSINDVHSASRHFSVSVLSTLVVISLFSIALLVSNDSISIILGGGNLELTSLVKDYLHVVAMSFIPLSLFDILGYNFQATGQLRLDVRCSIAVSVTDIALSFVFATVFKMGIAGFAWSLFISCLLGAFVFIVAAKKQPYLRLTCARHEFFHYLIKNVKKGVPLMIDDILYIIMFLSCNIIIVNNIGGNGPVVWGVASYFITIATILMNIISEATMTLGTEMSSTNDYYGCNQMIKRHRFIINIVSILILAFVELFPGLVMSLFGESGMVDSVTCNHLRMAVPIMMVTSIVIYEAANYYLLDKPRKYLLCIAFIYLGPVLLLLLLTALGESYSWWAFTVSTVASLVGAGLISKDIDKRISKLYRETPSIGKSVSYDFCAIGPVLESVNSFLSVQGVASESVNATIHCIDELSYNIIKHAPEESDRRTFDISATKVDDDIIILCRYGGKPFNPIMSFDDNAVEAIGKGDKPQLALRIFNHYAISPWYHYSYGVNALAMRLSQLHMQIKRLWLECFPEDTPLDAELFLKTRFKEDNMLAEWRDGQLVSMVHIIPFEDTAYFYAVATDHRYRRQGLSSGLIRKALEKCRERGFSRAVLIPGSEELARWYAGMGFSGHHHICFHTSDGYDFGTGNSAKDFAMVLSLGSSILEPEEEINVVDYGIQRDNI